MSHPVSLSEHLERAFIPSNHGVLGLVDELLAISRDHGLQLIWRADRCHVRPAEGGPDSWIEVPTPRSVIRAVLARVAALCNEHRVDSVSPYGGTGEIPDDSCPGGTLRVSFVNTPEEQSLAIAPGELEAASDATGSSVPMS